MALTDLLSAIGDAIRKKTGTTEKLRLDEMPQAIENIQGGSSGGTDTLVDYLSGKPTKISSDAITSLNDYELQRRNLTELNLPNLKSLNGNYSIRDTGIKTLDLPKLVEMQSNSISSNQFLESVNLPSLICGQGYQKGFGLPYNYALKKLNIPKVKYFDKEGVCSARMLERLDLPSVIEINNVSYQHPFDTCRHLTVLILRVNQVVKLTNGDGLFTYCPINNGGDDGLQGYIYVPKALLEDYKVATNWSVYADKFRAIEDYPDICGEVAQ